MESVKQLIEDAKSSKLNEKTLRKALITKLNYLESQLNSLLNSSMSDSISTAASQSFGDIIEQIKLIANTHLEVNYVSISYTSTLTLWFSVSNAVNLSYDVCRCFVTKKSYQR
jgi:hypothetical protein